MKSKLLLFAFLAFGAVATSSCSGSAEESEEVMEAAVSEDVAAELNEAQDLNVQVNELDHEVDAFLDSLTN